MYPLAYLRALMFGRGVLAVGLTASHAAPPRTDLADAAELAGAMPGILHGAGDHVSEHAALDCDWGHLLLYEAVLAGRRWPPLAPGRDRGHAGLPAGP